jgi:hypothetical protein
VGHTYTYANELFPSNVRGFGVGMFTIIANIAASFIPYIGVLSDKLGVHFLSEFVPLTLLVLLGSIPMTETMNRKMQN